MGFKHYKKKKKKNRFVDVLYLKDISQIGILKPQRVTLMGLGLCAYEIL